MSGLSVLFPAYIYPTATAWAPLTSCIAANPSNIFNVVINPGNGPGASSYPNSDYISAIANLNSYSNVNLYGYVATAYATRLVTSVTADVNTYSGWSNYTAADIHMDGIFFDSTPQLATPTSNVFMSAIAGAARAQSKSVYFNPGGAMDPSFYALADHVNAIEIPGLFYTSGIITAVPAADRANSSAIIYSFLGTASDQAQIIYNFANAGLGGIYVSTAPDFASFGAQWTNFCAALDGSTNGTSSTTSSTASATASPTGSSSSAASTSSVAAVVISSSSSSSKASTAAVAATSTTKTASSTTLSTISSTTPSITAKTTTTTSSTPSVFNPFGFLTAGGIA